MYANIGIIKYIFYYIIYYISCIVYLKILVGNWIKADQSETVMKGI